MTSLEGMNIDSTLDLMTKETLSTWKVMAEPAKQSAAPHSGCPHPTFQCQGLPVG